MRIVTRTWSASITSTTATSRMVNRHDQKYHRCGTSGRVCLKDLPDHARRVCSFANSERSDFTSSSLPSTSPPFGGRSSFPLMKGTKERIGIFKAQQEGRFVQLHGALFQIMAGKFTACISNELLKSDACVSKATLKRARAQAEFLSDILQRRTLPGQ